VTVDSAASEAPAFYEQTWDLRYRHALGATVGQFLRGLREHRILGRLCPGCERVLVPARSYCDRCHEETTEWREVGLTGAIEMFTIVYEPFKGLPDPPYALAYVTLAGADTALVGYVRGVDLSVPDQAARRLRIGTPVDVKFPDTPTGTVTDYWFELAESR
jgi:uncharacterized OB-fold protein